MRTAELETTLLRWRGCS